jgi:hypothetical protein
MNEGPTTRRPSKLHLAIAAGALMALASLAADWYSVEETIILTERSGLRPFGAAVEPAAYAFLAGALLTLMAAIAGARAHSRTERFVTSAGSVAAALVSLIAALSWRPVPAESAAGIVRSLVGGSLVLQPAIGLFLAVAGLAVAGAAGLALALRR